jgi:putative transposase
VDILREVMRNVKSAHPFPIDAMAILPDHLHALWTLPAGDCDHPMRWMLIKSGFSRRLRKGERLTASPCAKGERGIWQRRYWEHLIRDERDFAHHMNYIHNNPVKHRYVNRVADWPHSSFHRHVRTGAIPADWGADLDSGDDAGFGD